MNTKHINDVFTLKQIVAQQQKDIELLLRRIGVLMRQLAIAQGKGESAQLELEIEILKEMLENQNRKLFGPSSEKRHGDDTTDDTDADTKQTTPPPKKPRHPRRGHGPTPQPSLPHVDTILDLDDADKVCPLCGDTLNEMEGQYEESEEVGVIQRTYHIIKNKRKKYCCPKGCCVETAPAPLKLVPGGRYSVDFAVNVAIDKYADHLPLHRQAAIMKRHGIDVKKQTLWDQLWALSRYLQPTWEALKRLVLSSSVIGADETTWRMLKKGKSATWYVWAIASPLAVFFMIKSSRKAEVAHELLADYTGTVMVDGYRGYSAAQNSVRASSTHEDDLTILEACGCFSLAYCWAHARRKLIEGEAHYPAASEVLKLIGKLYKIEAEAHKVPEAERCEYLARLRKEQSKPIIDEIGTWLAVHRHKVLPSLKIGKAIEYTISLWDGLIKFIEDPLIPLDNNHLERMIRAIAIGRKNHWGSKSERGTEASAICYSLIESARLVGLDPFEYLTIAVKRAIERPGTVTLPIDLVKERQSSNTK